MYEKYGFKLYGTEERGFRYRDNTYATIYYMHLELEKIKNIARMQNGVLTITGVGAIIV